jgi:hypothetical protein
LAHYQAYFDASGHPDDRGQIAPAFFVSGFVANVEKWGRFDKHWLALLDHYDIAPPFHMKDFEAGVGQYAPWKDDKPRRDEFRMAAIRLINVHTNKPFSAGLILPDFYRMFEEYDVPARVPREPLVWCGLTVCEMVKRWSANRVRAGVVRRTDKIDFLFEDGDKHRGRLSEAFDQQIGLRPSFRRKEEAVAFQACDMLAWENRRWLTDRANPAWRGPRPSSVRLVHQFPSDFGGFYNWDTLSRSCEKHGWAKRVR